MRFSAHVLIASILILISPISNSAGIPIINGTAVQLAIQEEIKKRISDERREAMADLASRTGINIWKDQQSNDGNIAANTTSRLTGAMSGIHNRRSDSQVAPYMDACNGVSIARTAQSSKEDETYTREVPNRIGELYRAGQSPALRESIASYASSDVAVRGTERARVANDIRDYENTRVGVLDDVLITLSTSPGGLNQVFNPVVTDLQTKERTDYVRSMLIGDGLSDSTVNLPLSDSNESTRNRKVVEEGVYQVKRDLRTLSTFVDSQQTAVSGGNHLPLEPAILAAADPLNEERFAIGSGTAPQMMVDRSMLQRWVLAKSAKLAAMLQEYRRNQIEIMQLALLLTQRGE